MTRVPDILPCGSCRGEGGGAEARTAGGTSLASAILGSLSAITGESVRIGEDGELPTSGTGVRRPSCCSPTARTRAAAAATR